MSNIEIKPDRPNVEALLARYTAEIG